MSMIDTPLMRGLERVLDLSALRHQVIASTNLANVDTPGYHTRDCDRSPARSSRPWRERRRRYAQPACYARWRMKCAACSNVPTAITSSVERESLLLAQNQLRFQVAVQFLKAEFHRLSSAINGGSQVMNLFGMLELSGSALGAERQRAEVVASNMANAQTTRTPAGGPYRRQLVVFQSQRVPAFFACARRLATRHSSAVRVAAVVAGPAAAGDALRAGASRRERARLCRLSRRSTRSRR